MYAYKENNSCVLIQFEPLFTSFFSFSLQDAAAALGCIRKWFYELQYLSSACIIRFVVLVSVAKLVLYVKTLVCVFQLRWTNN